MDKEEAIVILDGFKHNPLFSSTHAQALDMAISALSENKGDLISRQAVDTLVDELARAISDERCFMSRGRSTGEIMSDILNLPSVENKGEWIPVSERLPEEECEVYCQLSDGSNAVLYVQDNWGQLEWVDGMMGTGTYDVVAWREKPEPYQKGGE
jgi:hypothetical protein